MSRADEIFKENCREILTNGVWDTNLKVRPRWEDGESAYTMDMLTANNWNMCQYAILVHVIADAHIYDRHIPIVEKILKNEPLPAPELEVDPDINDFYSFTADSFKLKGYRYHKLEDKIPVAV